MCVYACACVHVCHSSSAILHIAIQMYQCNVHISMKEYHHLGTKQLTGWRKRFDFVCDRRMFAHIAAMSTTLRTAHHLFYPDNFIASACTADVIALLQDADHYYLDNSINCLLASPS